MRKQNATRETRSEVRNQENRRGLDWTSGRQAPGRLQNSSGRSGGKGWRYVWAMRCALVRLDSFQVVEASHKSNKSRRVGLFQRSVPLVGRFTDSSAFAYTRYVALLATCCSFRRHKLTSRPRRRRAARSGCSHDVSSPTN